MTPDEEYDEFARQELRRLAALGKQLETSGLPQREARQQAFSRFRQTDAAPPAQPTRMRHLQKFKFLRKIQGFLMSKFAPLFLLVAATGLSASVTTFTDPAAFLAAAQALHGTVLEQDHFSGPKLNLPHVTLQDYSNWPEYDNQGKLKQIDDPEFGYKVSTTTVADGQLNGCVGHICSQLMEVSTVLTFERPLRAFGATFEYTNRDQTQTAGLLFNAGAPIPYTDGFFGFISTDPIRRLVLSVKPNNGPDACLPLGRQCPPPTTTFTLRDLSIQVENGSAALAPEPDTLALSFVSLVFGVLWFIKKHCA